MVSLWPSDSGSDSKPSKSSKSAQTPTSSLPIDVTPLDELIARSDAKLSTWTSSPTVLAVTSVAAGGIVATGLGFFWGRYAKRMKTTDWVTPEWLGGRRWVRGKVTSVGDGDNFRVFHTPPFGGYHWPLKFRAIPSIPKALTHQTLHVRLAGVDAPESAHFGKPAQPGAAEAKAWLTGQVLGRKVYVQMIRKDQYGRIVAHVHRPWRFLPGLFYKGPSVSEMMLRNGHATIYEQAGAEYGPAGREHYLALEETARNKRIGIWAAGKGESPAEFKKRYAARSATSV